MTKKEAIAKVFITAFKALSANEKELIVDELLSEFNKKFTPAEFRKLDKLANQNGKIFENGRDAIKYLNTLK